VARRSETDGGGSDRRGQQGAGHAATQESDSLTRAVLVEVWWAWLVFAEVFMALIVHPAMAVQ
jgi:hypothetical protein